MRVVTHPLGRHRQRPSDRACFAVILVRLATGCSWEDAERLCGNEVSDTTVRSRRDEWITAGVFGKIGEEAICTRCRLKWFHDGRVTTAASRRHHCNGAISATSYLAELDRYCSSISVMRLRISSAVPDSSMRPRRIT